MVASESSRSIAAGHRDCRGPIQLEPGSLPQCAAAAAARALRQLKRPRPARRSASTPWYESRPRVPGLGDWAATGPGPITAKPGLDDGEWRRAGASGLSRASRAQLAVSPPAPPPCIRVRPRPERRVICAGLRACLGRPGRRAALSLPAWLAVPRARSGRRASPSCGIRRTDGGVTAPFWRASPSCGSAPCPRKRTQDRGRPAASAPPAPAGAARVHRRRRSSASAAPSRRACACGRMPATCLRTEERRKPQPALFDHTVKACPCLLHISPHGRP